MDDERGTHATKTIAESIAASAGTEHVPVTFDRCDHVAGPFFHGTRVAFAVGDRIVPGQPSNYHDGRISNHVYFAALLEPAVWAAELATAQREVVDLRGRIAAAREQQGRAMAAVTGCRRRASTTAPISTP